MSIFGKLFRKRDIIKGPFLLISIGAENIKGYLFELLILDEARRDFRIKIIKSESVRRNKDYSKNDAFLSISDLDFAVKKLVAQFKNSLASVKDVILGVGSSLARSEITSVRYKREDPAKKIDTSELKYILHKLQWRALEDIRENFFEQNWEAGREVKIINSEIQEVRIDGYQVFDPIGFEGKEIYFSVFNSYLPKANLNVLDKIFNDIKISFSGIYFSPYTLSRLLANKKMVDGGIVVNIGGEHTDVILFNKNIINGMNLFQIGGNSFTRKLQRQLEVGFWEAEDIKKKYSENKLSESVSKKIGGLISSDLYFWRQALKLAVEEFPQIKVLFPNVFLTGGGGLVGGFLDIINDADWRGGLPFIGDFNAKFLYSKDIVPIDDQYDFNEPSDTDAISPIAVFAENMIVKENEIKKLLRKITNMMQE